MACAVLQKNLDTLDTELLKRAFQGVPGLTPYDAYTLGREAFGILVKGFQLEPATALKNSLAAQGVDAEVVDEAALPHLPEVQFLARLDCAPEGLTLYDQLGRTASLEWKDIALVAAGKVMMTEFNETKASKRGLLDAASRVAREGVIYASTMQPGICEEQHERCLLEIIPTGAAVRYNINADKSVSQLFQSLGARRTDDLRRNFTLLVQDILRAAPEAAINRGAYYLRENAATPFAYPSKQSFYSEIIWLLWLMGVQPLES
jgi:hypothetical protein